jgi:ribosomal protein S18 acetylase RimI-like enzyme
LNFRLYKPEDFPALYAIEEACFNPPDQFGRRYMRRLVQSPHAATWIAEADGKMAGFAIVEWTQEIGGVSAYVQTIEVAPDWRNRGTGRELLLRIEASAGSAGAQTIWLHADEENLGAIRLYRTSGYVCEGREQDYYAPGRPALVYRKPLEQPVGGG